MNQNEPMLIKLYVPGGLPSGQELAQLLTIVECSLVWSTIAIATEKFEDAKYWRLSGEEKKKAQAEREYWGNKLQSFETSFRQYITNKYKPLLLEVSGGEVPPDIPRYLDILRLLLEEEWFEERKLQTWKLHPEIRHLIHDLEHALRKPYAKERIDKVISELSFNGERFNLEDFAGWVSIDIGRNTLKTKEIRPDKSIEFVFDIAAITALLGLQEYPYAKDIIGYAVGVLRGYIGSWKKPSPAPQVKPPAIPPSMVRLMGQYDDVRLEWEGGESPKMVLELKGNKK